MEGCFTFQWGSLFFRWWGFIFNWGGGGTSWRASFLMGGVWKKYHGMSGEAPLALPLLENLYLKTLNGCIKSTRCAPPVSLICFSGADWRSTWKTIQRCIDCVEDSPFLHIKLKLSYICRIQFIYTSILCIYLYTHIIYIYNIYIYVYIQAFQWIFCTWVINHLCNEIFSQIA